MGFIIVGILLIALGVGGIAGAIHLMESKDSPAVGFAAFFASGISVMLGIWLTIGTFVVNGIAYLIHTAKS